MTPALLALAVATMRAAERECPALTRPMVLDVQPEPSWSHGVRGHFDAAQPFTIHIDPRERRVVLVVRHEMTHACRYAMRPNDVAYWSMGERVYR